MKLFQIIGIFVIGFLSGASVLYLFQMNWGSVTESKKKRVLITQDQSPTETLVKEDNATNESSSDFSGKNNIQDTFSSDTSSVEPEEIDTTSDDSDTSFIAFENQDTVRNDSINIQVEDQEIRVKKEQLVFAKTYPLIIEESENQKSIADSLLASNMGVITTQKKNLVVEFWKSPLSSKGYFYNNHKVKLYGIDPQLNYQFYMIEGQLYLKTPVDFYHLKPSNEFQKFIFADEALIHN